MTEDGGLSPLCLNYLSAAMRCEVVTSPPSYPPIIVFMRRESLHEGFNLDVRLQTEAAIDQQRQEIEIHDLAARVCYRDR